MYLNFLQYDFFKNTKETAKNTFNICGYTFIMIVYSSILIFRRLFL